MNKKLLLSSKTNTLSIQNFLDVLLHPKDWLRNSRPIALPQSLLPAISAVCIAFSFASLEGFNFNLSIAVLAVLGVVFGHLGSNLFDDYFDYTAKGVDYREEVIHKGMRARIGKCVYLKDGSNTVQQLLAASILFSGIAILIGFIIWLQRGNMIVIMAMVAAFLGVTYSGTPLKFSYRGLGEIIIGLMFGPLPMLGVFFAATGVFSFPLLYLACAAGLLVSNIIYTHSILDIEADKEVGKHTLAVLLTTGFNFKASAKSGGAKNSPWLLVASALMSFLPFVIVATGVALQHLSTWYLCVFLTFPMAISLFYLLIQFQKDPFKAFAPKFWMGPMEKWEQKKQYGVDWFLIRWMLARNLTSFFSLIVSIVSICIGILA